MSKLIWVIRMELYNRILNSLSTQKISKEEADRLVGMVCYTALKEIDNAFADTLEYIDFYERIEQIMYQLENTNCSNVDGALE